MGSFSLVHWVVVIVILLLVFGPKRLSEVGKGLGQGIRNFKKGIEGGEGDEAPREREAEAPRLKKGGSTKKLEAKRRPEPEPDDAGDDDDEDADEDQEEEVRPRKKSKRA